MADVVIWFALGWSSCGLVYSLLDIARERRATRARP